MTGVCPICDISHLARCPNCGYHPQTVRADLPGIARRLTADPSAAQQPEGEDRLHRQIWRAARLAGCLSWCEVFGATLIRVGACPDGRSLPLAEIYGLPGGRISARLLSQAELTPEETETQKQLFTLAAAHSLATAPQEGSV